MELQLGLALLPSKGFDLNRCDVYNEYDDISRRSSYCISNNKKRTFEGTFEQDILLPQTLPLLVWNDHPNEEEDDDHKEFECNSFCAINKNEGKGDGLVGWPPVKAWRKKICSVGVRPLDHNRNDQTVQTGYGCGAIGGYGSRGSNSMYVKVKMEGVGIARKVDLSLHHCFQSLGETLMDMFDEQNPDNYKLAYQDWEGDWLLAEDALPWRTFIRNVQRLKLVKSNG